MLKKDLAEALGVSGAMVTKLCARGMPTHSIAAARLWRAQNLSLGHTKQFRAPSVPRRREPDPVATADALNVKLRDCLTAGADTASAAEALRQAMRLIPPARRHELALFLGCWIALLGLCPTLIEDEDGTQTLAEDRPWFEIAAGLIAAGDALPP